MLICYCLGAPLTPFVFTQLDLSVCVRAQCACRCARRLAMAFVQGFKLVLDDALELSVPTHFRMHVISRLTIGQKVLAVEVSVCMLGIVSRLILSVLGISQLCSFTWYHSICAIMKLKTAPDWVVGIHLLQVSTLQ